MKNLIFFSLLVFFNSLYGGCLFDHLKKAEGKSYDHSMKNIDFIYMINLDRRPEKFLLSKNVLSKYGINPYRFSAVNGWELSIDAINDIGIKYEVGMTPLLATTYVEIEGKKIQSHELISDTEKTYFGHCLPLGALGCTLSHLSILQDAYESGYETIWVMEDDIDVTGNPHQLSELIDELDSLVGKDNWDVLFTDIDYRIGVEKYLPAYGALKRPDMDCSIEARFNERFVTRVSVNDHFRTMPARFGTGSMIIRRSGIIKLLEFAKKYPIYWPYDLENYLPEDIHRFGLTFDVVTNLLNSLSDLGIPDYLNHPH